MLVLVLLTGETIYNMKFDLAQTQGAKPNDVASPVWDKAVARALERFKRNLTADDDYRKIIESGTLADLSNLIDKTPPVTSKGHTTAASLHRLEPVLKSLDDLVAIAAISFGAEATVTALLWGSLRVIITLASTAGDILQNVLDMLEDLTNRLPRFRQYEASLYMDPHFEESLLELYTEIICFQARALSFLQSNPHVPLRRHKWSALDRDFKRTMQTINRMSSKVDSEAELARMRLNSLQHAEVLECMDDIPSKPQPKSSNKLYCNLPAATNQLFCGREEVLSNLVGELCSEQVSDGLEISAIYGMAGVGKTQIAREFIRQSLKRFDAIFWVNASSPVTIAQSFDNIAKAIASNAKDETWKALNDSVAGTLKWMRETDLTWLIIFDNVDDVAILHQAWPSHSYGSVLITCRKFSIAQAFGAKTHELLPFDELGGAKLLLKIVNKSESDSSALQASRDISTFFGGLPLALLQVGSFVAARKLMLANFLPLYKRNAEKIGQHKSSATDYEQTFHSLWDLSLDSLSGEPATLQELLSFMQPDGVKEAIFSEAAKYISNEKLNFLIDEISLFDAEEILLEAALIRKDSSSESLSMHRLIQEATLRRMTPSHRSERADIIVDLLTWGFPETWKVDVGHQFTSWERAEICTAHVVHLSELIKDVRFPTNIDNKFKYGQLLLRCSWYLYEREAYDVGWQIVRASIAVLPNHKSLEYASAVDLSGLIKLDMNKPSEAMVFFKEALEIRKAVLGEDDVFLASSLNNIAMAHMELGQLTESVNYHQEALQLRQRHGNDRIGNSLSNLSSTLLRLGDADEAERTLRQCPSLQEFTDETFLKTENPRFVGDLVLLSRIRRKQSRNAEALRLAAKALNFRRRAHGNRYKTCDSMLDVAQLLHEQGNSATSMELFRETAEIARTLPDGVGYAARAYFWITKLFEERGDDVLAKDYRNRANKLREQLISREGDQPFDATAFRRLTPFMLW